MNIKSLLDAICLLWRECLVERWRRMSVQVINDKDYLFDIWVHYIYKILDLTRPIVGRAMLQCAHMVPPAKRLHKGEYATRPVAHVFRIKKYSTPVCQCVVCRPLSKDRFEQCDIVICQAVGILVGSCHRQVSFCGEWWIALALSYHIETLFLTQIRSTIRKCKKMFFGSFTNITRQSVLVSSRQSFTVLLSEWRTTRYFFFILIPYNLLLTVLTERSIEDKRLGRSGASTPNKFSKLTPPTIKKMSSLRYNAKSVHKQFDLVKTEGGSGTVTHFSSNSNRGNRITANLRFQSKMRNLKLYGSAAFWLQQISVWYTAEYVMV